MFEHNARLDDLEQRVNDDPCVIIKVLLIKDKVRYGCLFSFLHSSFFLFVSCKCLHPRLDRTKRKHTYNTQSLQQRWCHFILSFSSLSLVFFLLLLLLLLISFFCILYFNESKYIYTYIHTQLT